SDLRRGQGSDRSPRELLDGKAIFDRIGHRTRRQQADQRDRTSKGIASRGGGSVGGEIVEERIDSISSDVIENWDDFDWWTHQVTEAVTPPSANPVAQLQRVTLELILLDQRRPAVGLARGDDLDELLQRVRFLAQLNDRLGKGLRFANLRRCLNRCVRERPRVDRAQ